jgi:hypothetical protein
MSTMVVQHAPVQDDDDCTARIRGMFKDTPEMTVASFQERTHADAQLDL